MEASIEFQLVQKNFDLYRQTLHGLVSSANSVHTLVPILQTLSLNELKEYILQKVDALDVALLNSSYFNACDIGQIFGDDIMQYILSFAGMYNTKGVNKKWRQYSEKNEEMQILKINTSINTNKPSAFKYDKQVNKTWIVNKNRTKLHSKEIELSYQLPTTSLVTAISKCKSGDRILIYDGTYELGYECDGYHTRFEIDKSIMIIGIGADVKIISPEKEEFTTLCCYKSIYIENISIEWMSVYNDGYGDHDAMWMNRVNFKNWNEGIAICVGGFSGLVVTDCEFIGNYHSSTAIEVSSITNKVNVERCRFTHIYDGCIRVRHHKIALSISKKLDLRCVDNVFEDNYGFTICESLSSNQYVLRGNVLKGFNGKNVAIDINDANKVYKITD